VTSPVAHQLAVLVGCVAAWPILARARWTWRSPLIGVATWHLWCLATVTAAVGLPVQVALGPYRAPVPVALVRAAADAAGGRVVVVLGAARAAVLASAIGLAAAAAVVVALGHRAAVRTRCRHLDALALVARNDPAAGDALVLDHPGGAAYCVPGTSVIVVSAGVLRALGPGELAAVTAHERAHLRARHDVALLPFVVLRRAFPWSGLAARTHDSVALLVEMCADDAAVRSHGRSRVRAALLRVATIDAVTPPGMLGAGSGVAIRVGRLSAPSRPLPAVVSAAVVMAGLLVATTPLSQFMWLG
jgi:hypothetical protein